MKTSLLAVSLFVTQLVFTTLNAQNVLIPDMNFKSALLTNSSINTNGDDEIQLSEAESFTDTLELVFAGISDFTGIEAFTGLTGLNIRHNTLTSPLDLSANTQLKYLNCSSTAISQLDLANLQHLEHLECNQNNLLTGLQFSNHPALRTVEAWGNMNLSSINLSGAPNLEFLDCSSSNLTTIDLSTVLQLKSFNCGMSYLTAIDVSMLPALEYLNVRSNQITSLDVTNNLLLTQLLCNSNPLGILNVTLNTELLTLFCSYNELTQLDVSTNTKLKLLNCMGNNLNAIDVSTNVDLEILNISYNNNISAIDISNNTKLIDFNCSFNAINSLDVTSNPDLQILTFFRNNIQEIDLSQNNQIHTLKFDRNDIEELDVTNLSELKILDCSLNKIGTLDLSQNSQLINLTAYSNGMHTLNVRNGNNTNVTYFSTFNNPNLTCVTVDDADYSTQNWSSTSYVDATTSFSEDCTEGNAGLGKNQTIELVLFPNPATDVLKLKVNEDIDAFVIIDAVGTLICAGQASEIDITSLSSGKYLIQVHTTGGQMVNGFFVKL